MYYDFRVSSESRCYSGTVSIQGDTLEDAYAAAIFLYDKVDDDWEVEAILDA